MSSQQVPSSLRDILSDVLEIAPEQVHGNATPEQAKSMAEDGIPVAPLLLPVTPPSQVN